MALDSLHDVSHCSPALPPPVITLCTTTLRHFLQTVDSFLDYASSLCARDTHDIAVALSGAVALGEDPGYCAYNASDAGAGAAATGEQKEEDGFAEWASRLKVPSMSQIYSSARESLKELMKEVEERWQYVRGFLEKEWKHAAFVLVNSGYTNCLSEHKASERACVDLKEHFMNAATYVALFLYTL